mmetsp:Transcript_50310/g.58718  ORF Transcript_50310/g.58718 Transcript_50310/m.58718 type:complete len:476 (-) Transcript_50310:159-1586(-)
MINSRNHNGPNNQNNSNSSSVNRRLSSLTSRLARITGTTSEFLPSISPDGIDPSQESASLLKRDADSDSSENSSSPILTLRVKCNSPNIDPPSSGLDWYEVANISRSETTISQLKDTVKESIGVKARGRYLRLIASGRLLAPDTAMLDSFVLRNDDFVHAVLAPAGVRGGQQAAMQSGIVDDDSSFSLRSNGRTRNRIGISADGLILPASNNDDDESDLEEGEERIGFDRLRSTGLTRDEISAIRLYFSRGVDQFVEERRNRRQNRRSNESRSANNDDNNEGSGNSESSTSSSAENNDADNISPDESPGADPNNGAPNSTTTASSDQGSNLETRERRRRRRHEDLWMTSQGPMSEFRLNLNSNNPLLDRQNSWMFGRAGYGGRLVGMGDDDDGTGVTFGGNATMNANTSIMVGTDRDFIWGFILGFLVGYVMLFWVWLPTVPHKQKLGILAGISCGLALNLLRTNHLTSEDLAGE